MTDFSAPSDGEFALNKLQDIAVAGADLLKSVGDTRENLMNSIKSAASQDGNKVITISSDLASIDISTGAGALVLDDYLQELSTVEQAAAQLVAAENKAQKQVHSVTGQG
jgi:hypothetical protein